MAVWAVTALVALRPAADLHRTIAADLGSSMAASSAANGVNWTWWQEFTARQPAFAQTFQPHIIGFASVLDQRERVRVRRALPGPLIASTGAAYVLIWMFLLGGILDRYARGRRLGAHGFFAASGVFLFRFLRLAVIAGIVWVFVFGVLHDWLFEHFYRWATREVTVERTAFALYAALTVFFVLVVGAVMMVFDYAKVRAVVEDRRSMIGALLAGARFVRRHPAAAASVFLLNVLLFAAAAGAYALLARGARGARPHGADRVPRRPGLHRGAAVREVVLLRVSGRPLPGSSRARRLHRDAPSGVAGLARDRDHYGRADGGTLVMHDAQCTMRTDPVAKGTLDGSGSACGAGDAVAGTDPGHIWLSACAGTEVPALHLLCVASWHRRRALRICILHFAFCI